MENTHTESEQLGDQRNDGESNFNSGYGTGQMAQPWMFMMMMMIPDIQPLTVKIMIDQKQLENVESLK
jgi:hypothetical protein